MLKPTSRIVLCLTVLVLAAGCARVSESRLNPMNWFGGARNQQVAGGALVPPGYGTNDARPYVAQVTALTIERTTSGAIIHATGITPTVGYWDAELIETPATEPGVVTYQFRMSPPYLPRELGTPEQRTVHVAATLSNLALETVRTVRVQSATNTMSVRR